MTTWVRQHFAKLSSHVHCATTMVQCCRTLWEITLERFEI